MKRNRVRGQSLSIFGPTYGEGEGAGQIKFSRSGTCPTACKRCCSLAAAALDRAEVTGHREDLTLG